MRAHFILITRILVDMRRNQYGINLFFHRKRYRSFNLGTGTLSGLNNLLRGSIDQTMII